MKYSEPELEKLRSEMHSLRNMEKLPSENEIFDRVGSVILALEKEDKKYRPHGKDKKPGGLLDFSSTKKDVIVVPDLHSRPDFLINLIDSNVGERNVLQGLNDGSLMVVCVGDGVHTETKGRCRQRWMDSYALWQEGKCVSESMEEEMLETFATMFVVMELKTAFPSSFHFLKGNHENVLNQNCNGDHCFRKVAMEGQMVRDFLETYYSMATTGVIAAFEHLLPIVAVFDRFGVSHGEPYRAFDKKQIIDYHNNPEVILGFTWTDNGDACDGSVVEQFAQLNKKGDRENCFWIGGHRPVEGKYYLRQDGTYIQIHNPNQMNVAIVHGDGTFDLEKDIYSIEENKL